MSTKGAPHSFAALLEHESGLVAHYRSKEGSDG